MKRIRLLAIAGGSALVVLAAAVPALAQTLYDAGLGSLPEAQGWTYGIAGSAAKYLTNDSAFLDTTLSQSTEAGWSAITAADLNRSRGFALLFTAMVNVEAHSNPNRAGFSVIVLGDDAHGIELAFWTNTIFAQSDSPLFTQGEQASFNTAGGFVNYALLMQATNYVLQANGGAILTGPVRNYTAFNGFPNPYRTPDFLFFGDDTTSASASFNVRKLTLILPPIASMKVPGVVAWTGVSNQTYHVQSSTNLVAWNTVGLATSSSNAFAYTNGTPQPRQFFQIIYP